MLVTASLACLIETATIFGGQSPKHVQEIIADNLSKSGWSWACVATMDREERTIFVADAHRGDGQRFIVHTDEKLTAFLQLESATRLAAVNTVYWQTITMSNLRCTTER
jgi:hypothetical protein